MHIYDLNVDERSKFRSNDAMRSTCKILKVKQIKLINIQILQNFLLFKPHRCATHFLIYVIRSSSANVVLKCCRCFFGNLCRVELYLISILFEN